MGYKRELKALICLQASPALLLISNKMKKTKKEKNYE